MRIVDQIYALPEHHVKEVQAALINASLAYESGLPWKPIFSHMRSKYPAGRIGKVCSFLLKLTGPDMDKVSKILAEDRPC